MSMKKGKRVLNESTAARTGKKMKRTLLCTYFMTLASVVLCFAMFLGTTLAWFTSEVTNSGNVIQVGTLKAMMYHVKNSSATTVDSDGTQTTTTVTEEILLNDKTDYHVFDTAAWAPTKTQTQVLKVVNTGDLNFNYQLGLLLGTTAAATEESTTVIASVEQLQKLLGCFEVYACAGNVTEEAALFTPTNRVKVGEIEATLAEFLTVNAEADGETEVKVNELVVFKGTLIPDVTLADGEPTTGSVQYITVGIKMMDTADTTLMGQSFTVNVKLSATQTTVE